MLGGEDSGNSIVTGIWLGSAVLAGIVFGFFAFLLATAVPATLHFGLPHLPFGWFLGIWVAMIALFSLSFRGMFRRGDRSGRIFAATAGTVMIALFIGEVTGIVPIYPWRTIFFMTGGHVG